MVIHLDRFTNLVTDDYKPIASTLTVEQAAQRLAAMDLPLYVEARWQVTTDAPVSVERQVATKVRRLRQLAAKIGRAVVRVDQRPGFPTHYVALLAR